MVIRREDEAAKRTWKFQVGDTVFHRRGGGEYYVLARARLESDPRRWVYCYTNLHQSDELGTWVRDADEFEDGRFTLDSRPADPHVLVELTEEIERLRALVNKLGGTP